MSVFRIHKTENYSVIANFHFKEKEMSLKAKGLLSLMLSLPDTWQYSISGLVKLSKDGKDSVMSALSELEEFGYLKRTRITNDKGQFSGVQYDIFEQPQKEDPISANQNSEKSHEEKSNSEDPRQLNTNSINYLLDKIFYILNTNDPELIALYREYIQARENMEAPLNELSLEKLVARAKRLSKNNVKIEKVLLETAIINGWKNVYLPRESELEFVTRETKEELLHFLGLE